MTKTNVHDPKAVVLNESILTMPLDDLRARVVKALELWQQILALLPGGMVLTDDERAHSNGRLRDGENEHLLTILAICEKFPLLFESLADLDEGVDPKNFETPLLRDRLERAAILAPLADALSNAQLRSITDSVLHLRDLARTPISEAYGIAKSLAKTNGSLKSMLATVLNYYRALAAAAAAARKANLDAKAKG